MAPSGYPRWSARPLMPINHQVQISRIVTSMLLRVAFEYGQVASASSTSC
jgi:hypothetical protein